MKHTFTLLLFSLLATMLAAQQATFDNLRARNVLRPPAYNSLTNASAAGSQPGNLVYIHSGADSGVWVRNWSNTAWNKVTGSTEEPSLTSGWNLTGNAATNPITDKIGTLDSTALNFVYNNKPVIRFDKNSVIFPSINYGDTSFVREIGSTPISLTSNSFDYFDSIYIAITNNTNARGAHFSRNGVDWIYSDPFFTESTNFQDIAKGDSIFVAVARTGTQRAARSVDGKTWTLQNAAAANTWVSVAFGNGQFVAVSDGGTDRVMRSADGITWTSVNVPSFSYRKIIFANNQFVAVGNGIITSPDGLVWTSQTMPVAASLQCITYGGGKYVAAGPNNIIFTSVDGITWEQQVSNFSSSWLTAHYAEGSYYLAGFANSVAKAIKSSDGIVWDSVPITPNSLWATMKLLSNKDEVILAGNHPISSSWFFLTPTNNKEQIVIGSKTPRSSAVLDIQSKDKGVLLPALRQSARNLIPNPAEGLLIYNPDVKRLELFNGNKWSGVGGGLTDFLITDSVFYSNLKLVGYPYSSFSVSHGDYAGYAQKRLRIDDVGFSYVADHNVGDSSKFIIGNGGLEFTRTLVFGTTPSGYSRIAASPYRAGFYTLRKNTNYQAIVEVNSATGTRIHVSDTLDENASTILAAKTGVGVTSNVVSLNADRISLKAKNGAPYNFWPGGADKLLGVHSDGSLSVLSSSVFGWQIPDVENNTYLGPEVASGLQENFPNNETVAIGYNAGTETFSNQSSVMVGTHAGYGSHQNGNLIQIGPFAGSYVNNLSSCIFIGNTAGSLFYDDDLEQNVQPGSNNIILGNYISLPNEVANRFNIGGVLYGMGVHQDNYTGKPIISPSEAARLGVGVVEPTAVLDLRPSTNLEAVMRLRVGPAPDSPNDGDIWLQSNTATGLKIRLNGQTFTVNLTTD